MKLFKCMISGDELTSDSYRPIYPEEMKGACMKQKAKYRQKKGDQICIASDEVPEDDPDVETVVDIVDSAELQELTLKKKDIMTWGKAYLKAVEQKLKDNGKTERIPDFKAGATALFKLIIAKFDEMQIFSGKKGFELDPPSALCFAYQEEQEDEGPTFLFFADGLEEEKL